MLLTHVDDDRTTHEQLRGRSHQLVRSILDRPKGDVKRGTIFQRNIVAQKIDTV